jgi:hypothetical protein
MRAEIADLGLTMTDCLIGDAQQYGSVLTNTSTPAHMFCVYGAPWVMEAAKKLEALGRLPAGWDSHGGRPLNAASRELAVSVLGWLENEHLPVPAVVLGPNGTVQLEWRAKGKELDVELCGDSAINFVKESPEGELEEGRTDRNLQERLKKLTRWLMLG